MRRFVIALAALAPFVGALPATGADITVYRNAGCGCCGQWAEHMRQAGHSVTIVDGEDMSVIKKTHGVPEALHSCHTALVEGYVVEGHVPADDVARLLREKPAVKGIAVPGMPLGSPGMEMADGTTESFDVLTFGGVDGTGMFASH